MHWNVHEGMLLNDNLNWRWWNLQKKSRVNVLTLSQVQFDIYSWWFFDPINSHLYSIWTKFSVVFEDLTTARRWKATVAICGSWVRTHLNPEHGRNMKYTFIFSNRENINSNGQMIYFVRVIQLFASFLRYHVLCDIYSMWHPFIGHLLDVSWYTKQGTGSVKHRKWEEGVVTFYKQLNSFDVDVMWPAVVYLFITEMMDVAAQLYYIILF